MFNQIKKMKSSVKSIKQLQLEKSSLLTLYKMLLSTHYIKAKQTKKKKQ